jgi:hypothetical protein
LELPGLELPVLEAPALLPVLSPGLEEFFRVIMMIRKKVSVLFPPRNAIIFALQQAPIGFDPNNLTC